MASLLSECRVNQYLQCPAFRRILIGVSTFGTRWLESEGRVEIVPSHVAAPGRWKRRRIWSAVRVSPENVFTGAVAAAGFVACSSGCPAVVQAEWNLDVNQVRHLAWQDAPH